MAEIYAKNSPSSLIDLDKRIQKYTGLNLFTALPDYHNILKSKNIDSEKEVKEYLEHVNSSNSLDKFTRRDFVTSILALMVAGYSGCKSKPDNEREPVKEPEGAIHKYLILDSGHGGTDKKGRNMTGTVLAGDQIEKAFPGWLSWVARKFIGGTVKAVCEDEVTYDVLCRTYQKAKNGRVIPIIIDDSQGYKPINHLSVSAADTDESIVKGSERIKMEDPNESITNRIKTISSYYRALRNMGIPKDHIRAVSLHADESDWADGAFAVYPDGRKAYGGMAAYTKSRQLKDELHRLFKEYELKTARSDFGYPVGSEERIDIFKALPEWMLVLEMDNMSKLNGVKRLNNRYYRDTIADVLHRLTWQ